jgi:molybdopterin converting factor small subunit
MAGKINCKLELPGSITTLLGIHSIEVEAATLSAALEASYQHTPALRALLTDESGAFREHVLCFHRSASGSVNTRWMESLDVPLAVGDSVLIMQAVSGG